MSEYWKGNGNVEIVVILHFSEFVLGECVYE